MPSRPSRSDRRSDSSRSDPRPSNRPVPLSTPPRPLDVMYFSRSITFLLLSTVASSISGHTCPETCDTASCPAVTSDDCFPMDMTKDVCNCCDVCPLTFGAFCDSELPGTGGCAEALRCEKTHLQPGYRPEDTEGTQIGRCVWQHPGAELEPFE